MKIEILSKSYRSMSALFDYLLEEDNIDELKALKLLQQTDSADWTQDNNFLLTRASVLGLSKLALQLLRSPAVLAQAASQDNLAFLNACKRGYDKLALVLLKNSKVRALAATQDNLALKHACIKKLEALVLQLLTVPQVRAQSGESLYPALIYLIFKSHETVALKLLQEPQVTTFIQNYCDDHKFPNLFIAACKRKLSKIVAYLLKQQHPIGLTGQHAFKLAIENNLHKLIYILLKDPKLGTQPGSISAYQGYKKIFGGHSEKLTLKAMQYPAVMESMTSFDFFRACQKKWSNLALKMIQVSRIRDLLAVNLQCLIFAPDNKLEIVTLNLLKYPEFASHASFSSNFILYKACEFGLANLALKLIEFESVCTVLAQDLNYPILLEACRAKFSTVALRILEYPNQLAVAAGNDNQALCMALKQGLGKVALRLWEAPLVKDLACVHDNALLVFACKSGLAWVAMQMLQNANVAAKAANYNNAALIFACQHNRGRLALRLLELPAVQAKVSNHQHLALQIACSHKFINDKLIHTLLKYSNVKQCLNGHEFWIYPGKLKSELPFGYSTVKNEELDQNGLSYEINTSLLEIRQQYRSASPAYHCFKMVMAFDLFKPWINITNNEPENLQAFNKYNLNSAMKTDLLSTLKATQKALQYYFPLYNLPKQNTSIPVDIVNIITSYDSKKDFRHLRYAAKELYQNPGLRMRLAQN